MAEPATPSLVDLYAKVSNPRRTDRNKIHVAESSYITKKSRRRSPAGSQNDNQEDSVRTRSSRSSNRSRREEEPATSVKSESRSAERRIQDDLASLNSDQKNILRDKIQREKDILLGEITNLQANSEVARRMLTRPLTQEDDISTIRWEKNRIQSAEDCQSAVATAKLLIGFIARMIDGANRRYSWLHLDGWYNEVTANMDKKYDRALQKVYMRYFRKTSINPLTEIVMGFFGSLLIAQFSNMIAGPRTTAPAPTSSIPQSRNVPFNMAPPTAPTQRAPMAPPMQRAPMAPPMQRAPMAPPQRAPMAPPQRAPMAPPQRAPMAPPQRAPMAPPRPVATPPQRQAIVPPIPSEFMIASSLATPIVFQPPIEVQIDNARQKRSTEQLEIIEESSDLSSDHTAIDMPEDNDAADEHSDSESSMNF